MLYAVVRDHFETFRASPRGFGTATGCPGSSRTSSGPSCGVVPGRRLRAVPVWRLPTERLVAFSCKGRGFCPSCGGRRMAERAAHLVDHVFPDVPVRQWVLSVPHRIRYVLAWHHDLCRRVARLLHRAVEWHLRAWARDQGLADPRGGGVAVIQRFGGSVNLHVHVHALVLDGVFARTTAGALRFHAAPPPSAADMADILTAIVPAVRRLLARHGLDAEDGMAADRSPRPRRCWRDGPPRRCRASPRPGSRRSGPPTRRTARARRGDAGAARVPCALGGLRSARGRQRAGRASGPPGAPLSLHVAAAAGRGAPARTPSGDVAVQLRTPWAMGPPTSPSRRARSWRASPSSSRARA